MGITQLLERLPAPTRRVAAALHDAAVAHGCAYRIDPLEEQTGHKPDLERSFFVHQKGHGRAFVCHIPVT